MIIQIQKFIFLFFNQIFFILIYVKHSIPHTFNPVIDTIIHQQLQIHTLRQISLEHLNLKQTNGADSTTAKTLLVGNKTVLTTTTITMSCPRTFRWTGTCTRTRARTTTVLTKCSPKTTKNTVRNIIGSSRRKNCRNWHSIIPTTGRSI